jgi:hypothetical protein
MHSAYTQRLARHALASTGLRRSTRASASCGNRRVTADYEAAREAIHESGGALRFDEVEQGSVNPTRTRFGADPIGARPDVLIEPSVHQVQLATEPTRRHCHPDPHWEVPFGKVAFGR